MLNQVEYYASPEVRNRIAEYCGGSADRTEEFTAEYLVGYGEGLVWEGREEAFVSTPKDGFHWLLDRGFDIFRSNWDRAGTLGIIDIEYFNIDHPGDIYLDPARCFELLEPTRLAVRQALDRYGIPYLEIMTGQGYHFSTRIKANTEGDAALIGIGRVNDSVAGKYAHPTGRRHRYVSKIHGQSFDGMGRLMEYLCQGIMRDARSQSPIPIVTTDVAIGQGRHGREAISLDLSMYGDPVYMRDIRCPFSTHQKHKVMRYKVGDAIAESIPIQTCFPTGDLPLAERLAMRRHFQKTADWASACGSLKIPNSSEAIIRLAEEYQASRLAAFHRNYDAVEPDAWTEWPWTYDRFDPAILPPCIAYCLQNPNPHLLKPTNIQALTRTLLFKGWHPKHVAGLIRSKYERNHGWEGGWAKYDASMRAEFYVRLFAGQIATGLDQGIDHNCVSHREKGFCLKPWCGWSLSDFR
jgi:hypothetical protein